MEDYVLLLEDEVARQRRYIDRLEDVCRLANVRLDVDVCRGGHVGMR